MAGALWPAKHTAHMREFQEQCMNKKIARLQYWYAGIVYRITFIKDQTFDHDYAFSWKLPFGDTKTSHHDDSEISSWTGSENNFEFTKIPENWSSQSLLTSTDSH
jgi:hypothetical protein